MFFITLTFKNDIRVLNKTNELFNIVVQNLQAQATGDFNVYALYQPIPTIIAQNGLEKGGDVLGLTRFNETLVRKLGIHLFTPPLPSNFIPGHHATEITKAPTKPS